MALIPSGMGWSAEENYMKQYAGQIATVNAITSELLEDLPVATTVSDIISRGVVALIATGATTEYRYILATDTPGVKGAMCKNPNNASLIAPYGLSASTGAKLYYLNQYRTLPNGDWNIPSTPGVSSINNTSTSYRGIYFGYGGFNSYNTSYTITPYIFFDTTSAALTEAVNTLVSTAINKIDDGYCAIAWVKYKTYSDVVSVTPVLISTVDDYTFFSYAHNETFSALYYGKRFYFSFSYETDAAQPYSILTLDYTGATYPVMSPALMFEYVARSVSLTVTETGDPWGGPTAESGGGDGAVDSGDDIPFATPPVASAVGAGLFTMFTPDLLTIQSLANYMWSTLDVDVFKKIFANPIDVIMGLHIVPCSTIFAGNKEIKVGGIGTGISCSYTANQYASVNCGGITIPKKWGAYLDYSPYTKTEIWLPYIGFRELNIDDIQGKTIYLNYWIDVLSGSCNAELRTQCDDGNSAVLYSWSGHCAAQVPVTGADMRSAVTAALSIAASAVGLGSAIATGGATAPMAADLIASAAVNSMALKPTVRRSGSVSGSVGFLAQQTPYIVRSQPNIALPAEQNKLSGYPSFTTVTLGSLSGYNEVEHIHLEGVAATSEELDEIEAILKEGVLF